MSLTAEELKKMAGSGGLTPEILQQIYTESFDTLQRILVREVCRIRKIELVEPVEPVEPPKVYA